MLEISCRGSIMYLRLHGMLVFNVLASSDGSDESIKMHSLVRGLTAGADPGFLERGFICINVWAALC